uniref:Uncharacterized protein n=1 Tax=Ditylenchus dipsaci TaxID=166011 RepID=A0A915DW88_9BILA
MLKVSSSTALQFLPPPPTPSPPNQQNEQDEQEDDSNRTLNKLSFSNPNSSAPSAAIGRVLPVGDDNIPQEQDNNSWSSTTSTPDDSSFPVHVGELAPVWAVGLAIVVGVVCGGLSLALIGAYLCYRRQRSRMRTAEINTIKAPTLHAFNPQT